MTEEEQWAFWSTMNSDVIRRLTENELRRERRIHALEGKIDVLLARTKSLEFNLTDGGHPWTVSSRTGLDWG